MKTKTKYGQARRLASTTELTREQWLDIRQLGIGSSDAAVAVGLSPYKCPLSLWLEKTARKAPEDISQKEAVLWGVELEPVLAQVYTKRTGYKVRRVNAVLQHPEHTFMLANLDREVVGHPDGPGILEIKTASYHSAPQWEEGVPVAYQCQVLHQLAVTGHAWAEVAVLIGGQDFRIYRIERDEEKIGDLIRREAHFWQQVRQDWQPEPDGSSDAAAALGWLFPRDDGQTVDLSDSPEFNQLFGQFFPDTVNAHGFAADKVENALGSLSAAEKTAAAVAILFSVFFISVRTADRTEFRHHEISGVFRPKLGNYSDDLGDNVAGTMDNDRVSDLYTHVL